MSFIEMDHIRKSFGSLEVLKDVTLHVETGEVISIIGPSGSGKSTFLRCLCQLETINSGSIVVDGQTMVSTPEGSSRPGSAAHRQEDEDRRNHAQSRRTPEKSRPLG